MELATVLFDKPVMSNLSRGLWGYHGRAGACELTVQSTGIGGPSAAVVVGELAGLGVRRAIRVGTCIGLVPELAPGDVLVVREAIAADGVGLALHPAGRLLPDPRLTAAIAGETGREKAAKVASSDLYEHPDGKRRVEWREAGAAAVDLSAAAVLAMGRRVGIAVACGLVVAESLDGHRLADADLDAALLELGRLAGAALAEQAQAPASPSAGA